MAQIIELIITSDNEGNIDLYSKSGSWIAHSDLKTEGWFMPNDLLEGKLRDIFKPKKPRINNL